MKKLFRKVMAVIDTLILSGMFYLPVIAEDTEEISENDAVLPIVFGVLAFLAFIIIFLVAVMGGGFFIASDDDKTLY